MYRYKYRAIVTKSSVKREAQLTKSIHQMPCRPRHAAICSHANLAIVYMYKQVDRNPDHVGHKLLEPGAELMQASTTGKV